MGRANYSYNMDNWDVIRWRGAVTSALKGTRGQEFLKKLRASLEALPQKRLASWLVCRDGEVCAIGALVQQEGGDVGRFEKYVDDPEDADILGLKLSQHFDVAKAMIQEIMFENDEYYRHESDEERYSRMLDWVNQHIKPTKETP